MNPLEYSRQAFHDIWADCPANHCQALSPGRVHASPGGWSSARRLIEGLYGGKAIVNLSQQLLGNSQLPTVEILCDDPLLAAGAFPAGACVLGQKDGDGAYAIAFCEGEAETEGNLVTAGPESLCAAAVRAAGLIPAAIRFLLDSGVAPEEIQWGWSCCPVNLLSPDTAAAYGVCDLWVRGDSPLLERLAGAFPPFLLRLHDLTAAKTYLSRE